MRRTPECPDAVSRETRLLRGKLALDLHRRDADLRDPLSMNRGPADCPQGALFCAIPQESGGESLVKLVPATPIGSAPAEMVFIGNATIEIGAPDEMEASQLELRAPRAVFLGREP